MLAFGQGHCRAPNGRLALSSVRSVDTGLTHTLRETPAERVGLGLQLQWRQQQSWLLGEPFSFALGSVDGRIRERLLRFWQEAQWGTGRRERRLCRRQESELLLFCF
jgi:hypothetical protein